MRMELGKKRPDGRFNVWDFIQVREDGPEWVVVHVVPTFKEGVAWIDGQIKGKRKEKATNDPSASQQA